MGLWLLSRHSLRFGEPDRPAGRGVHGALPKKGGGSMWAVALHCDPTGEWGKRWDRDGGAGLR